jgi:DNA-directed RNA polymerase specialized sigma24 family protein
MNERSACSCSICGVEHALIEELAEDEAAQQYHRLVRESSILSGFPTALVLLRRLRDTTTDEDQEDSSDEILGELLRPGERRGQELRQRLVLLILMPAAHRTSRQIAYGFPSLARDDIGQQVLTSILEILQSKALLKQQSHFAFTITRLMRRHSFRWAIREARLAPTQELAVPVVAQGVHEDSIGFETTIHLREFLRGCLHDGQLTETEYELLMLSKIQGVSVEVLAAREGLSEIAFRHRMQRVVDKLRRIAQSPSLAGKRRAASGATTALPRLAGRGISAA